MHFYNVIKEISQNKEIELFIDMDGVIASYDVGNPAGYLDKRPLMENINKLEVVGKIPGVKLNILSICRKDFQIDEKNQWLDKNAPFFEKNNRIIISKEKLDGAKSAELKANYLKDFKTERQKILVDDDNTILKKVQAEVEDIIVFQDSELID